MGDIKNNLRRFQKFHLCSIGQKRVSFNSPIIPSSSKAQHVIEEHIHMHAHTYYYEYQKFCSQEQEICFQGYETAPTPSVHSGV